MYFGFDSFNSPSSRLNLDEPFAGISPPEGLDQATHDVVQGHIDRATAHHKENPDDWDTWAGIGGIYELVQEYELALLAYEKSLEIKPNNIVGHINLANLYRRFIIDYEKSVRHFELAIDNDFGNPDLYIGLAQVYLHKIDQPEKAEETLKLGAVRTSHHPNVLVQQVLLYKKTEDQERYKDAIRNLLTRYPDNQQYQDRWGSEIE